MQLTSISKGVNTVEEKANSNIFAEVVNSVNTSTSPVPVYLDRSIAKQGKEIGTKHTYIFKLFFSVFV